MVGKIVHAIQEHAMAACPGGPAWPSLTVAHTEQIAAQHGVTAKAIEILALENGIVPLRYQRNLQTYSPAEQARLLKTRMVVVGLGGLGGTVIEILARAGVGALDMIDYDIFEDHNLNRQLLSTQDGLGSSKAEAARNRVQAINASVEVTIHDLQLTPENALRLIGASHVVIDCLDDIDTRFTLESAAKHAGRPLVSAAVAGLSGHITTIFPEDVGLALIYGPREALHHTKGAEITLGCLPQAVSTIAALESAAALALALGKKEALLRNRMLFVDLNENRFDMLRLA
jgi:molybdopterin-synthase adenylyltransferase